MLTIYAQVNEFIHSGTHSEFLMLLEPVGLEGNLLRKSI